MVLLASREGQFLLSLPFQAQLLLIYFHCQVSVFCWVWCGLKCTIAFSALPSGESRSSRAVVHLIPPLRLSILTCMLNLPVQLSLSVCKGEVSYWAGCSFFCFLSHLLQREEGINSLFSWALGIYAFPLKPLEALSANGTTM